MIAKKPESPKSKTQSRNLLADEIRKGARAIELLDKIRSTDKTAPAFAGLDAFASQLAEIRKSIGEGARIAVVGSECSGKSAFINALFGQSLLPMDTRRCSLAIVELHACTDRDHGNLKLSFIDENDFSCLERQAELAEASPSNGGLNELKENLESVRQSVSAPDEEREFKTEAQLAAALRETVASATTSLAVSRAVVKTKSAMLPVGTIVYDAPGINSGIDLHDRQLSRLLKDCDAVILVKDIDRPTPDAAEQRLIKQMSDGANKKAAKYEQRLFLFLSKLDRVESDEKAKKLSKDSIEEWAKFGVDRSRIYAGSSVLELEPEPEMQRYTESLQKIVGFKSFNELKLAVQDFAAHGKLNEAKQNAEQLNHRVERICLETQRHLELSLGDVLSTRGTPQQQSERVFFQRVDRYIDKTISREINSIFEEAMATVMAVADEPSSYRLGVVSACQNIAERAELSSIVEKYNSWLRQPEKAEDNAREAFFTELSASMKGLGEEIASEVYRSAMSVMNVVVELCWGDTGLRDKLVGDERVFAAELRAAIESLLMRYANPVLECMIYSRKESTGRQESGAKWEKPMATVQLYMGDETASEHDPTLSPDAHRTEDSNKPRFSGLLRRPRRSAYNEDTEADQLSVPSGIDPWKLANGFEAVSASLQEDVEATRLMLETGVYSASGVEQYCEQVLRTIRQGITDNANRHLWTSAAVAARDTGTLGPDFDLNLGQEDEATEKLASLYWELATIWDADIRFDAESPSDPGQVEESLEKVLDQATASVS